MKSINSNIRFIFAILSISGMTMVSCKGKQTDAEIQSSINEKIASNNEMKGLNASVKEGVVTLSGECATEECKKECADEVKDIKGVKNVENNIQVASAVSTPAPVQIDSDETLKSSVNDVIKSYKGVEAEVKDGVVILRGEIKRGNLQDLIVSVNELRPRKIDNQLVIK